MNYELMAQILEKSKARLWNGTREKPNWLAGPVCYAIIMTSKYEVQEERDAGLQLCTWISKSMGKSMFVQEWLGLRGIRTSPDTLQAYRLLWIDQMIGILRS